MKKTRTSVIIFLISIAGIFSGCSSGHGLTHDQRKAQKKLRKAIEADPNIIALQYTDTTITGTTTAPIDITVPGFSGDTDGFDCDSLKKAVKALKAKGDDGGLYLHQDSLIDIKVKEDPSGQLSVAYNVKPRIVHDTVTVPFEVEVSVPGKAIKVYIEDSFYHHIPFWIAAILALLMTGLWLSGLHKNRTR